jgi:hypothetical protein
MKIDRVNRITRRKPAPAHFVHHKSHMTRPGFEPTSYLLAQLLAMSWTTEGLEFECR